MRAADQAGRTGELASVQFGFDYFCKGLSVGLVRSGISTLVASMRPGAAA